MLSKAEVLYLQGEKQVSDSYEYKLKSILRKKIANFLDKELPLLTSLFPDLNLTKISKYESHDTSNNLSKFSKRFILHKHESATSISDDIQPTKLDPRDLSIAIPKYYINSPTN